MYEATPRRNETEKQLSEDVEDSASGFSSLEIETETETSSWTELLSEEITDVSLFHLFSFNLC